MNKIAKLIKAKTIDFTELISCWKVDQGFQTIVLSFEKRSAYFSRLLQNNHPGICRSKKQRYLREGHALGRCSRIYYGC